MATVGLHLIGTSLSSGTMVTFPQRNIAGTSTALGGIATTDDKIAIILAETPFHPVDRSWPDQPSDRGTLRCDGREVAVETCDIFAVHRETSEVKRSQDVGKSEKGNYWFVVGHIAALDEVDVLGWMDKPVTAEVDAEYRYKLSMHHTASHLAAFALNYVTREFWSKDVLKKDTLGSPNLDNIAMDTSLIFEDHAEDRYRFGKSIRKLGLNLDALLGNVERIEAEVNERIAAWILTKAPVKILAEGPYLTDTRKWQTSLPEGMAEMYCGGSHVEHLGLLGKVIYSLKVVNEDGERKLLATTRCTEV